MPVPEAATEAPSCHDPDPSPHHLTQTLNLNLTGSLPRSRAWALTLTLNWRCHEAIREFFGIGPAFPMDCLIARGATFYSP